MKKLTHPEYAELILRGPTKDGFNIATFEDKEIKVLEVLTEKSFLQRFLGFLEKGKVTLKL